ncbi:hypothetical protein SCAR479_09134 [Seiridium cardinale]|uniref:Uncharacterized protein n=1 Tax=Seiridium cardinale TaxID=138064 RepID=A0ABR2XKC5_9PEZI
MESKLRSWSNQGNDLKITVLSIFKEVQAINKDGKTGRGATNKHTAALNKFIAQQEASGSPALWKDVYRLMECSSAACTNRGLSCWRNNEKHYKLGSDIMERLVDYAEEDYKLETHTDVPEGIHSAGESQLLQLDSPVLQDKAPIHYSRWLSAKVTNHNRQEVSQLAGQVTVDEGYDLHWLFTHRKAGKDMLIENGVMEGVAASMPFHAKSHRFLGRLLNVKPSVPKLAFCTTLSTAHSLDTRLHITLKFPLNETTVAFAL